MPREYPTVTPQDVALLKQLVGDGHVSAGASNLDLHSRDESYHEPHRPDVVVWPQTTDDVVAAVRLAAERGYAVTPWCAGTSLEGNPIPVKAALAMMGMIEEQLRLPLVPLSEAGRETLTQVLRDLALVSNP